MSSTQSDEQVGGKVPNQQSKSRPFSTNIFVFFAKLSIPKYIFFQNRLYLEESCMIPITYYCYVMPIENIRVLLFMARVFLVYFQMSMVYRQQILLRSTSKDFHFDLEYHRGYLRRILDQKVLNSEYGSSYILDNRIEEHILFYLHDDESLLKFFLHRV